MSSKRDTRKEIRKIVKAKRKFHRGKAKMSFHAKIEELVKLQKLANDIKSNTGRAKGYVWQL